MPCHITWPGCISDPDTWLDTWPSACIASASALTGIPSLFLEFLLVLDPSSTHYPNVVYIFIQLFKRGLFVSLSRDGSTDWGQLSVLHNNCRTAD